MRAPADALRAARALIAKPGTWIQGRFRNSCGFCSVGALLEAPAAGANEWLRRAVNLHTNDRYGGSIIDWNDDPKRTHEEVLTVFDTAINLAEAE